MCKNIQAGVVMIWWSIICLSPTQCQCLHCFLFFGVSSAFLVPFQNQSSFWQVRKPKVTTASLQPKSTDGIKMHSQVLNVRASNRKRLQRYEERKKVKDPDSNWWRCRARRMTEGRLSQRGKNSKLFQIRCLVFLRKCFYQEKKPEVTWRQKKHHCIKRLKRKHCHEPFQFFSLNTDVSVFSDIPSICKCSSVGRSAMRRQKLLIIDAMHSLLTVTSALRVKIRPIHGSS